MPTDTPTDVAAHDARAERVELSVQTTRVCHVRQRPGGGWVAYHANLAAFAATRDEALAQLQRLLAFERR